MGFEWSGEFFRLFSSITGSFFRVLPFMFVGVGVGAFLETWQWNRNIAMLLSRKHSSAIVMAAVAGTFSPLCSCGVIPGIASLLIAGVPMAPVMAFWVSSPLMNPEAFVITYGTLGSSFAVVRVVSTLTIGLMAGYGIAYLGKRGFLADQIKVGKEEEEKTLCCKDQVSRWKQFGKRWLSLCLHIGKYMILAFAIEAIMVEYFEMDWMAEVFGRQSHFGPLFAGVLGIPLYTSGIAGIPLIRGMMDLGMDQGSALAFLIGGAATSIPAMIAVSSLVKRKTFLLYLLFTMGGAVTFGYAYRLFT